MYYIADIYLSGKAGGYSGSVRISSDGTMQDVCVQYNKNKLAQISGGNLIISENRLFHNASENETILCIFRKYKIIRLDYVYESNMRKSIKKIKSGDFILLMSKDEISGEYARYMTELFRLNNRRRNRKKKYMPFRDMFKKICRGNIFILIQCTKNI